MPARFDHASVAAHTCSTCHNSVQAIGMRAPHPDDQQCDVCHGTLAWKPPGSITPGFISAAPAATTTRRRRHVPRHMITRLDCATCHSFPDWSLIRSITPAPRTRVRIAPP